MHYSLRTEQNYVYWVRWFIRWHGLRHPKEMGGKEVEAFLTMLANVRKVSPSTHRQALSALLSLYKEVLEIELPWMQEIGRPTPTPTPTKRIPVVLTVEEVTQILLLMNGVMGLLARLIYGTGLRLREASRMWISVEKSSLSGKAKAEKIELLCCRSLYCPRCVIKLRIQERFGRQIAKLNFLVWNCPLHWRRNTRVPGKHGRGNGHFLPRLYR